jgi:competence protein ComEC
MFDVGQGDSILIHSNNTNMLIDTGGKLKHYSESWMKRDNESSIAENSLIPFFKSMGIRKLQFLELSHGDYDHMGEAINLVNNFKVEKVIFNCGPYNDLEKELIKVLDMKKIKYYSCIKELNIDNNKLYFLPTNIYDNENDNSNVIYTELDGYKFIFMGDAGVEKEKDILNKYNITDIDVLKVGHHGSKTSSGKEFINEINPKYSVISVGRNNRYGHPNKEVLDNLKNSKIYRTDQDGSIMFKIKNNKLKIETCSP